MKSDIIGKVEFIVQTNISATTAAEKIDALYNSIYTPAQPVAPKTIEQDRNCILDILQSENDADKAADRLQRYMYSQMQELHKQLDALERGPVNIAPTPAPVIQATPITEPAHDIETLGGLVLTRALEYNEFGKASVLAKIRGTVQLIQKKCCLLDAAVFNEIEPSKGEINVNSTTI